MRIGIEAQRIFRYKKYGMDIVALEIIKALQKLDTGNEYVIFVKPGPDAGAVPQAKNFKIVEVKAKTHFNWEQIALPLAAKRERVDALHCTSNTAPVNVNVPTVITLHDITYLERISFKGTFHQIARQFYDRWNVLRVVNKAIHIIVVSEFGKAKIAERLPRVNYKVQRIYNGVFDRFHEPIDAGAIKVHKTKYGLPEDYMFFLGSRRPGKNLTGILKAYNRYQENVEKPLPLVIAGLSKRQIARVLGYLSLSHLLKYMVCPGYIPQGQLPFIYAGSAMFLYPSLRESFGMPVIEAMASGTPVITSNTSSLPEVAGGAARLADPFNHFSICSEMVQLHNNEALRHELIRLGKARARAFSWGKAAQKIKNVYEMVLSQQPVSQTVQPQSLAIS